MSDSERNRIEKVLQRKLGMDREQTERLNTMLDQKDDWFRICPDGRRVYGTPAQLKRPGICGS